MKDLVEWNRDQNTQFVHTYFGKKSVQLPPLNKGKNGKKERKEQRNK